MKVNKLDIEYEFEFELIGIVSAAKDYKLAWAINKSIDIELIRDNDHELFLRKKSKTQFAYYSHHTEHTSFRLFKNRSLNNGSAMGYLIPELKQMDYFLVVEGEEILNNSLNLAQQLNNINVVNTALKIATDKLKSKENLLV